MMNKAEEKLDEIRELLEKPLDGMSDEGTLDELINRNEIIKGIIKQYWHNN